MVLWIELLLGFFFELDFCLDLFCCIELLLEPSFVHWNFAWDFFLALDLLVGLFFGIGLLVGLFFGIGLLVGLLVGLFLNK